MYKLRGMIICLFFMLMTSCSSNNNDTTASTPQPTPGAPTFATVNTSLTTAKAGTQVTFTVTAKDESGNSGSNLSYTLDSPSSLSNAFDPNSHTLTWNTVANQDEGTWDLVFTVSDSNNQTKTSMTVTVSVLSQLDWGGKLYDGACSACHGAEGAGASASNVQCKTSTFISSAIQTVFDMNSIVLQPDQLTDIAYYLGNVNTTTPCP